MELILILVMLAIILSPLIIAIWFLCTVTKRLKEISYETKRIADMMAKQNPQTAAHNPQSYYRNT